MGNPCCPNQVKASLEKEVEALQAETWESVSVEVVAESVVQELVEVKEQAVAFVQAEAWQERVEVLAETRETEREHVASKRLPAAHELAQQES